MPKPDRKNLRRTMVEIFTENLLKNPPVTYYSVEALWLQARFGMLGSSVPISEEEAHELWGLSTISHVAWDLLVEHLTFVLALESHHKKISLPQAFKSFLVLRMRGGAMRPDPRKRKGDTRDRNLCRDYVIHGMLSHLASLGFNKTTAAEVVHEAFQRGGYNMVSFDVVRHVQRNAPKLSKEVQELENIVIQREFRAAGNTDSGLLG